VQHLAERGEALGVEVELHHVKCSVGRFGHERKASIDRKRAMSNPAFSGVDLIFPVALIGYRLAY